MKPILAQLVRELGCTDCLRTNVVALLSQNGCSKTAEHCLAVAAQAQYLAEQFGVDPRQAQAAGWLHDVSAIIPTLQQLAVARQCGLEILEAEETAPMLLHQKLSAVIAQDVFGIQDHVVLSAVGCHTTLKAQASQMDKVVFIADKIAWDQPGDPPYRHDVDRALTHSLDRAVLSYLDHLWQQRETLAAVHPWFVAAYWELKRTAGKASGR